MGILNVTPDSFSDGGRFDEPRAALSQAKALAAAGADIIDIGAVSTRPGHEPVTAETEWSRLAPVLRGLSAVDVPLSIDTYKAVTARAAIATGGACIVNDVWGLQKDPAMAGVVAETGAGLVIMHNRDHVDPAIDMVDDIRRFFDRSLDLARAAGIDRRHVMLDPGLGFGKTAGQNLAVLARLTRLADYGLPLLVGVSRKSMFGTLLGLPVEGRLAATLAANLAAARRGAAVFRVHDVAEHVAAFKVADAIDAR